MTAREYIEKQTVTLEERIQYQLHRQGLTISQLLKLRRENGEDRTEEEIREYERIQAACDDDNWYKAEEIQQEKLRYSRYMTKMPKKAYLELCKRLRVEPEITYAEKATIRLWLDLMKENGIEQKQRLSNFNSSELKTKNKKDFTKPTKKIIKERQKLAYTAEKDIEYEDMRIEEFTSKREEIYNNSFVKYAESLSNNVLNVWHKYFELFERDYLSELDFIYIYSRLNESGKKVFHEVILQYFDEDDYTFEDNRTEFYRMLGNERLSEENVKIGYEEINEIYDLWLVNYGCGLEYMETITKAILEFTQDDWKCIIDYHKINVIREEVQIDDKPFLDYLEQTFYIIAGIPSFS